MPVARETTCKDCGQSFAYGTKVLEDSARTGVSPPVRCPNCTPKFRAEKQSVPLAYYTPRGIRGAIGPTWLGKVSNPPPLHEEQVVQARYDELAADCGLKDEDVLTILARLREERLLVVQAPTGTGKSTLLPYRITFPPVEAEKSPSRYHLLRRYGTVRVTQPRRLAATGLAKHLGNHHESKAFGAGGDIGYAIGGDVELDGKTVLGQVTDGWLVNQVVAGRLEDVAAVIIDEAHERSVTIDLLLAVLRRELVRFPHLRVMAASATIDLKEFQRVFGLEGDRGILDLSERARRNELVVRYHDEPLGLTPEERLPRVAINEVYTRVVSVTRGILEEIAGGRMRHDLRGDVIVFAHTTTKLYELLPALERLIADTGLDAVALPLHGKLAEDAKERATRPRRPGDPIRVIAATNVAETSLTVSGARHVVDCALNLASRWDSTKLSREFSTELHSRAGCKQRWGRVGRNAPGMAHTVHTEAEFASFFAALEPSVLTANLDELVLKALRAGMSLEDLDEQIVVWESMCESDEQRQHLRQEYQAACRRLVEASAVDAEGDLTRDGVLFAMTGGGIITGAARLLARADEHNCLVEAASLVAMLADSSSGQLWTRPDALHVEAIERMQRKRAALRTGCRDDVDYLLKLMHIWDRHSNRREWAASIGANPAFMAEATGCRDRLLQPLSARLKHHDRRALDRSLFERLRIVIAAEWPHESVVSQDGSYAEGTGMTTYEIDSESVCRARSVPRAIPLRMTLRPGKDGRTIAHVLAAAAAPETELTGADRDDDWWNIAQRSQRPAGCEDGWLDDQIAAVGSTWSASGGRLVQQLEPARPWSPIPRDWAAAAEQALIGDTTEEELAERAAMSAGLSDVDEGDDSRAVDDDDESGLGDEGDEPRPAEDRARRRSPTQAVPRRPWPPISPPDGVRIARSAGPKSADEPLIVVEADRDGLSVVPANADRIERLARFCARPDVVAGATVETVVKGKASFGSGGQSRPARWLEIVAVGGVAIEEPVRVLVEPAHLAFTPDPRSAAFLVADAHCECIIDVVDPDIPFVGLARLPFLEAAQRGCRNSVQDMRVGALTNSRDPSVKCRTTREPAGDTLFAELSLALQRAAQQARDDGQQQLKVTFRGAAATVPVLDPPPGLDGVSDDRLELADRRLTAREPMPWELRSRLIALAPERVDWAATVDDLYRRSHVLIAVPPTPTPVPTKPQRVRITGMSKPGAPARLYAEDHDGRKYEVPPEHLPRGQDVAAHRVGQKILVQPTGEERSGRLLSALVVVPLSQGDHVTVTVRKIGQGGQLTLQTADGREVSMSKDDWSFATVQPKVGDTAGVAVKKVDGRTVWVTRRTADRLRFVVDPAKTAHAIRLHGLKSKLNAAARPHEAWVFLKQGESRCDIVGPSVRRLRAEFQNLLKDVLADPPTGGDR